MYPLNHGDTVVFGDVVCVFINPNAASAAQSMRSPIRGGVSPFSPSATLATRFGARTAPSTLDQTGRSPISTIRPATMANYSDDQQDTIREQVSLLLRRLTIKLSS